jgi:alanyl-tRNA synthetase
MAFDFRALKAKMKPEFHRNFRKYYPAESLESVGFTRRVCKSCGRGFWSAAERDVCDEPVCSGGYRFIGEKLTRKRFAYKEAWDEYVKTFGKWGYVPIERYPVVCRWYEDLYFVNAGVNDFQPYVISGEVEPPAPAVLEPQFCLRFQDIDSVGITGRHYSGFIMVGQHTFNTPERHVFFKDEGILQMHEFLTMGLGINPAEICYHEDVWAGGGNFGPSMEFFCRGLELGNQVYMQYKVLPDGSSKELNTRVIDMGAGLERWSWFSQGNPMSYDSTFPNVMKHLYRVSGWKPDEKLMLKFGNYAGLLSIDDVDDINSVWGRIAKELGVGLSELKEQVYRTRALYAIADHTRSLLVAIHDGALPSNVGGGYNLRTLLRRCWSLNDEFDLDVEVEKVFEEHIGEFGKWYTDLKETGSLFDIIAVERERYMESQEKGRKLIEKEKDMTVEKMVELYDSHGIAPDVMQKITGIQIPDDFYKKVEERHEAAEKTEAKEEIKVPGGLPETVRGFYEDQELKEFKSKVLAVFDGHVVLDKTYFYPEGGGQESDFGTCAGKKVKYVQKIGKIILHDVEDAASIKVGSTVECKLDDKRRIQLMQHHTATHIVNASARSILGPHIWQAGAHKSEESSRLDITHYKAVSHQELKTIEDKANIIVAEARPVEIKWMKRNDAESKYGMRLYQGGAVPGTELRIVSIPGVDTEACGGTHLKNTKEAGHIKLLSAKRIQDGVVRLEFTAGGASRRESGKEEELYSDVASALGVKAGYMPGKVQEAARIFRVQPEQLPQTIDKFRKEHAEDAELIRRLGGHLESPGGSDDLADASNKLFEAWKQNKKTVERLQADASGNLAEDIESKFAGSDTVKHLTRGLTVKALTDLANKAISKPGRLLILVNTAGDKVNVVVASSGKRNAGDVCRRLCAALGGGGGGKPALAMGGGNAKDAEKVISDFMP